MEKHSCKTHFFTIYKGMKYLFFTRLFIARLLIVATLAVLTAAGACTSLKTGDETGSEEDVYEGAFYEGSAMGYRGIIRVRVGLDRGTITDITVLESREDWNVGEAAIEELTDLALMYNTTELDAVSGATETSRGFLKP